MAAEDEEISIDRASTEDIESLRPLWLQLHRHHQPVGPQSGEFSDDETSWGDGGSCFGATCRSATRRE